eukprot:5389882-Pyramimonas_sp.AAC.1
MAWAQLYGRARISQVNDSQTIRVGLTKACSHTGESGSPEVFSRLGRLGKARPNRSKKPSANLMRGLARRVEENGRIRGAIQVAKNKLSSRAVNNGAGVDSSLAKLFDR